MTWLVLAAAMTFPTHVGLVTDAARMLNDGERARLESTLRDYERQTGNEVAVVSVSSLDGNDLREYAAALFKAWGIGKKGRDNGVLLLWAVQERKVRLEVGYGLEPRLPDGRAGQIIREQIVPRFREQQWSAGLDAGIGAVIAQLAVRTMEVPVMAEEAGQAPPVWLWVASVLFVGGACLVAWILWRPRRKQREEEVARARRLYESDLAISRAARYDGPVRDYVGSRGALAQSTTTHVVAVPYEERRSSSSSSNSYDSGSSSSSSSSGGGFDFGGGSSGGGGADSSY